MKNLFVGSLCLLVIVSFVAEGALTKQKTTKSGATFTLMTRDELKAIGLDVDQFLGHEEGEAWRAPDTVKQVGAKLVKEGTASTLKYTGIEISSGMIWGDMAREKDESPRLFEKVAEAIDFCKKIGAKLPTTEDFIVLRNHLGARWDNSWGKLYSNSAGYSPQVLPSLYKEKDLGEGWVYKEPFCFLSDSGMVFSTGNGVLASRYCDDNPFRKQRGYEVRCVVEGKFKESHGNPKTQVYAQEDAFEVGPEGGNYRERFYGYVDANHAPEVYPKQYVKKSLGEGSSNPHDSDHWVAPNRGDASRVGDKTPYIYQPRNSYEYNSVRPRTYKN